MPRLALVPFALSRLLDALAAQGCATASDTWWQRDTLPQVPSGLSAVSVIQGLCEGESAGVVFQMPANMAPQIVTQVVAPWGAAGGVNGFNALLDVEVYDGVSFSGAVASMGTRVFSLSQQLASNMQVASHGLNALDTSTYNIVVGTAPPTGTPPVRRFAVCFRCDVNLHPSGSCATGWPADFFTDNNQTGGFTCNNIITPLQTSLIEILGQGWRDAALASVGGIQLCPIYYKGIWCIRCCTRDAFPASYSTFGTGCTGSLGVPTLQPISMPRIGQNLNVLVNGLPQNLCFLVTGWSNTQFPLGSLPYSLAAFGAPSCLARVSNDTTQLLIGTNTIAFASMALPNNPGLLGAVFYHQALVLDPPANALGATMSNAAAASIGQ